MFQITDVPRVLPEILLVVLALLVLGSDIFEKWKNTPESRIERAQAAGSLTAIGLGMVFAIALLQSGYLYTLPADAPSNPLTNLVRNLQAGGPGGAPIAGAFATDDLTMIARLILIGAAFLTALLAYDYRPAGNPAEFYALILASTAGMGLMAGASDLIVAFLAVELTSIPLYVLAGYFRNDQRSSEAGMKYLLFGALSSGILLYGMSLAYGAVVTSLGSGAAANSVTNFATLAQVANGAAEIPALLTLAMVFMIAGIGYKIAVVPFHGWSPDVYQGAPTPVTAFIATASKAAGFILLFRLLASGFPGLEGSALIGSDFGGWTSLLALMAALTLVIGNLAALPQTSVKRLLAYSSIAHAGFILLGLVAWADPQGFDRSQATSALVYYVIVYVITNLGAFGALAAVGLAVGGEEQRDLRGLAQRNLPLALFFAICLLSLAGIPPLAGFFAKFYVFMVAWQVGAYELVILALITTVISLYYYLRLLKAMFIEEPETSEPVALPRSTAGALITAVVLLLVIGIFPNLLLSILSRINLLATGL